jgi:putative ABC transport system permease protein
MMWRLAWRISRGQSARLWLLIICMALGIAARVCVGSFSASLDRALTAEARPLLGADIEIAANQPLSEEQQADLLATLPVSAQRSAQVRFTTMAIGGEDSGATNNTNRRARTVEVRAVDHHYPLYGNVVLSSGSLAELFNSEPVVFVQGELLTQLQLSVGGKLRLGTQSFRIAGLIIEEPGMGMNPFVLGPRVLMARSRLEETGLVGKGARLRYSELVALPPQQLDAVVMELRERWKLPERMRSGFGGRIENEQGVGVRTAAQANETIERAFDRIGDFLRLVALAAVLLGGIGVASLVRGFVAEQRDTIATLTMLGATQGWVARMFLLQSTLLGIAGGILGAVAGVLLQNGLLYMGQGYLPITGGYGIDVTVMGWGVLLGGIVAAGFAAIAVCEIYGLQPAAIARGDRSSAGGRWRVMVTTALLLAVIVMIAAYEAHSWITGPLVIMVLVGGAVLTAAIGWILLRVPNLLMASWRGRWSVGLRHGVRNLTRPGFRPLAAVIAIAAATQLMATMATYRTSLTQDLQGGHSQRPGTFCIDIAADEAETFRLWVQQEFHAEASLSPIVLGRLRAINGKESPSNQSRTREGERARVMSGREQRLSWRTSLGPDEEIVAGQFMREDSERIEASLEQRFAADIGAQVGDLLSLDVQGVPILATVTSIRRVRWANLRPNFFMLLSPSVLREAPGNWVASIPVLAPAEQQRFTGALSVKFPTVTAFDVAEIGGKLQLMLERLSLAVNFLGWFCLAAGILVLIGIGIGTARARRSDAALLAVLGARPRVLFSSISAEFACLAGIAGICGVILGVAHAYIVLSWMLNLPITVPWVELMILALAIIVSGIVSGLFACRQVFMVRPLIVLRDE